jgi:hypothetical protein
LVALFSALYIFGNLAIIGYYWATIPLNLVTRVLTDIYFQEIYWVIDDTVLVFQVSILFCFSEGQQTFDTTAVCVNSKPVPFKAQIHKISCTIFEELHSVYNV